VAHNISALIEYKGLSLDSAARVVVKHKLVKAGGTGGVICINRNGDISMPFNTEGMFRGYATSSGSEGIFIFTDEPDKLKK
jgi:L-asparaginase / beta-aspartyl-peptidase